MNVSERATRGNPRCILLFVVLAFAAPAAAQPGALGTDDTRQHQDWLSIPIEQSGMQLARAAVEGDGIMAVDSPAGHCDTYMVTLMEPIGGYSLTELQDRLDVVQARIDERDVHEGVGGVHLEQGDDTLYLPLFFEDSSRFYEEIQEGNQIRFRFSLQGTDVYKSFSLAGSRQALERAADLCEGMKSPEEFFPDAPEEPAEPDRQAELGRGEEIIL